MIRNLPPEFRLPPPPERYSADYERLRNMMIEDAINTKLSSQSTNAALLLSSDPSGKVFEKTLDDSGNWITTLLRG